MRYLTWNMQGGNDGKYSQVAGFMIREKIQIACLQETGTLPATYVQGQKVVKNEVLHVGSYSTGGSRGAILSVVNYDNQLGSNNRCSLAVFCSEAVLDYDVIQPPSQTLRPIIGIKIPGDRWIYCVHAPSSSSAAGVSRSMLGQIPATTTRWACFGDYNCEPGRLQVPSSASAIGGTAATHQSGSKLDYVVTRGIDLTLVSTASTLVSDHYSQVFEDA